jgi:hypothetical protein
VSIVKLGSVLSGTFVAITVSTLANDTATVSSIGISKIGISIGGSLAKSISIAL